MRFAENSFNADCAACRDGDLRCGIADTLNGFRVLEQIVQPALTVTFGGCGGADAVLRQKLRGGCCKPFYLVGRGVRAELRGGNLLTDGCRRVLDFTPQRICLDMGDTLVTLYGADLRIESFAGKRLIAAGRFARIELRSKWEVPQE